jgi:predicted dienelactone hydrolase
MLVLGVAAAYLTSAPAGPALGSASELRLRPGPHTVQSLDFTFVDTSRATQANGDAAGAASRTLEVTLWFPRNAGGAHPLVVYSHGFMSMRSEAVRYAEHLASHGFVVISADYPLTNFRAPGGPNIADLVNQPGDVAFLIDSVTGWTEGQPFRGTIDAERIGVAGLSLGGLTSTLAAFHPTLRDPRISAAVSIAGPTAMFTQRFFETAAVPFLMIAGEVDAIVDYASNAEPLPAKLAHGGALLTLAGGTHTGFGPMSDGVMRILGNPDRLGCWALTRTLKVERGANPFAALGGEEQGIAALREVPPPCAQGAPKDALAAGRQLMATTLALRAFFESVWASDAAERAEHAAYLADGIARDFEEARFAAIAAREPAREIVLPAAPYHPNAPLYPEPPKIEISVGLDEADRVEAFVPTLDSELELAP